MLELPYHKKERIDILKTKEHILELLEQYKGSTISGSNLSTQAGVTRAAVWKIIKELKSEGYDIASVPSKGYTLEDTSDIVSAEGIKPFLLKEHPLIVRSLVSSTNTELKRLSADGASDETVMIALEQTDGRGRRGNSFFSPVGGIYISFLIRPKNITTSDAPLITTAAAVAICRAVKNIYNTDLEIKWINDLFLDRKKVCGILTEASSSFENGCVESIVVGAGINLSFPKQGYPAELNDIIGNICGDKTPNTKNRFCAELINQFYSIAKNFNSREFLDEYKDRLFILNKKVAVKTENDSFDATAIDIDRNACLVVNHNGKEITLNSGEVSIIE